MDQFLLITTPEWTEVLDFESVRQQQGIDNIQGWINQTEWGQLTEWCLYVGIITEDFTIVDARMFSTGEIDNPHRFWYIKAPV